MAKQVQYRGLCLTCNNASTCTFPRDPDRPVLQCEEFEGYEYAPPKDVGTQDSQLDSTVSEGDSRKDVDSNRYIGLCRTCEERESCKFTKPEGGVWHCEEYR